MRERAAACGGNVTAGPRPGDGWSAHGWTGLRRLIKILLADDEQLLRLGFRMVFEAGPDLEAAGEAGDPRGGPAGPADPPGRGTHGHPGPPGRSSASFLAYGCWLLTTFDLDDYAFAALRAGAGAFLLKNAEPAELLAAIRTVARGDAVAGSHSENSRRPDLAQTRAPHRAQAVVFAYETGLATPGRE
jgi:DNA-binding NarL/FixJ family response regulator